MNVKPLIIELRKERELLDEAILALEGLAAKTGRGRPSLRLVRGNSQSAQSESIEFPTQRMTAAR